MLSVIKLNGETYLLVLSVVDFQGHKYASEFLLTIKMYYLGFETLKPKHSGCVAG